MKTQLGVWLLLPMLFSQAKMALPEGNDSWVVQVATTGGLLGTGIGDYAISSEGRMICYRELRCPDKFNVLDFHLLIENIALAVLAPPDVSLCSDCITTVMTIRRRDSMGVVHTQMAFWDDTTKKRIPQEVIRIYDAVLALRR